MAKHIVILVIGLSLSVFASADTIENSNQEKSVSSRTASNEKQTAKQFKKNTTGKIRVFRTQIKPANKHIENTYYKDKYTQDTSIKYRSTSPEISSKTHMFEIYDAESYLNIDYDGDGYYSDFTIEFDADTVYGHADVYAELYLSAAGGAWVHYHTTDVFSIHGNNGNDNFSITTRLKFDYTTADYDVLIDLYEVGYDGIMATIGPAEDIDLYKLPLEDTEHELGNNNTNIVAVSTELLVDTDGDDFYTALEIEYDIDTITPGVSVYSEIILTHTTELWQYAIETESFVLHKQTEKINIELDSNFEPAWYDIEIRIMDAYTRDISLAIAAQDFSSLTGLPLESIEHDDTKDYPSNNQSYINGSEDVISSEEGGGSLSHLWLLLFILLSANKNSCELIKRKPIS